MTDEKCICEKEVVNVECLIHGVKVPEYIPRTIDQSIEECRLLKESGKIKDEPFADGDYKVGDIKNCHKCGKPCSVVTYNGFGQFSKSVVETCIDCHEAFIPTKCTDKNCKVHDKFDEEEYAKDDNDIHEVIIKIKEMLEHVDPKSDSIMEYDRLYYITAQMFPNAGPVKWDFWLYNGFIDYLGLKGRLRLD